MTCPRTSRQAPWQSPGLAVATRRGIATHRLLCAPLTAVVSPRRQPHTSVNFSPPRHRRSAGQRATVRRPPTPAAVRSDPSDALFELVPVGDGTSSHLQALGQGVCSHAPAIRLTSSEDGRTVVGRKGGGKADLELDVASLSASHAALTVSKGRLYVTDLGSTNGTRVNGRQLRRGVETRLYDGQVVILGDEHLAAFEVSGAGTDGGLLSTLSGVLAGKRSAPSTDAPAATIAQESPAPGQSGPDAGKVAGAVLRGVSAGLPAEAGQVAAEALEAAAESGWETAAEGEAGEGAVAAGEGAATVVRTASSSSVEVVPAGGGAGDPGRRLAAAASGKVAETAGPFGPLAGLAEATSRLGASITNSQVQVNYQYKPVVQFNTGGKPLGPGELKSALLVAIAGKNRGLRVSERDSTKIEQLARSLEAANPTPAPLRSPLLNGRWELQYTTCRGTLGGGLMRPSGPIYQTVDIFNLKVLNEVNYEPLPFLKWTNSTSSSLNAKSESRAAVKPEQFRVGPFKMKRPPQSPGRAAMEWEAQAMGASSEAWLDTSYLDADTRISRNSNGDLFVFTRDDPNEP